MPYCQTHLEQPLDKFGQCNKCLWLNYDKNKLQKRIDLKNSSKFERTNKQMYKDKLKARLQQLVSRQARDFYKSKGLYLCWIDGVKSLRNGLYGLHASHYYAKGDIWQLWFNPVNVGLSSYNRNINKPETVASMRNQMAKVWGDEAVNKLDIDSEVYKRNIATGIDPKYPTEEWLMASIEYLKKNNVFKIAWENKSK